MTAYEGAVDISASQIPSRLEAEEPELRDYLQVVSKRKWWIAVALVACVGSASALTFLMTPVYEAEAKLFVGTPQVRETQLGEARDVTELSIRLLQSYAAVLKTHPVAAEAIEEANLPLDAVNLSQQVTADPITDTQLIRVRYRHEDRVLAQTTVNAVSSTFVRRIQAVDAPAEGPSEAPAVRVAVVEPALLPRAPVSPNPVMNISLAVVLGLLLGVGFAFLAEYLDTRIKSREDAERTAEAPVLAAVPKIKTRRTEIYVEGNNQSLIAETYRKLLTSIELYGVDRPVQVVLVTSPRAQEGKTTTATNLAVVSAYSGISTLLLEGDLRRPRLHTIYKPFEGYGLTTTLVEHSPLAESVVATDVPKLWCLPAAAIPPNPVQLLGSRNMRTVVDELRRRYKLIVIDAPPILPVADARHLVKLSDGVLLVCRPGETRRDAVADAALQVRKSGGTLLGVVLNASESGESGAEYYSYYSSATR